MSEENTAPTEQAGESTTTPEESTTTVKDPEAVLKKNRELLGKNKEVSQKYEEAQRELQALKEEKLESQGKYADINKTLKQQLEEKEQAIKQTQKKYAYNAITNVVKSKAAELGCTKPEAVLRLMDKEDMELISVDDNFNVDNDACGSALERVKESYPELFKSSSKKPADIPPNSSSFKPDNKKDISNMSLAELNAEFKKTGAK